MLDIENLIKEALINKSENLNVYRSIKAEIMNFKTAKNAKEYNDVEEIKLLQKMVKQREDAYQQYVDADRTDLADNEKKEMDVIKSFLPKPISEEEIKEYILELGKENNLDINEEKFIPKQMMGKFISSVKTKYPTADGKMVANIVKNFIK